jgi:hypothetical protein
LDSRSCQELGRFGIIFVPPLFCISHYFYMFAIIVRILLFISFIFLVIMFIVYFDYMLSIVGLSSCSYISLYIAHFMVSGQHCVSVVLIRCLPVDTPYIPGYVVDRGCDTPVESFIVHSLNIGLHRIRLRRKTSSVLNLP